MVRHISTFKNQSISTHMYINKSIHASVCLTISWNWWSSLARSPDARLIYESQLLSHKSAMNNWNLFSCFVFLRFFKMWIILKVFIEFVTILLLLYIFLFFFPKECGTGASRRLSGKETACQCWRLGFNSWARKIPGRRRQQPTPVFLPGESHGQSSLAGYSLWGCKRDI